METKKLKDSERYYKSFIEELEDYNDLSSIDFFIKYCLSGAEEYDIKKEYETYSKDFPEDEYDYEEWLEKIYYEDNEDYISDRIREYFDPLDITTYVNERDSGDKIYQIQLAWGGPNVDITINTKWGGGIYEFYWGGDQLKRDVSNSLCGLYCEILGLDY